MLNAAMTNMHKFAPFCQVLCAFKQHVTIVLLWWVLSGILVAGVATYTTLQMMLYLSSAV